jgi:hypothetical protein
MREGQRVAALQHLQDSDVKVLSRLPHHSLLQQRMPGQRLESGPQIFLQNLAATRRIEKRFALSYTAEIITVLSYLALQLRLGPILQFVFKS